MKSRQTEACFLCFNEERRLSCSLGVQKSILTTLRLRTQGRKVYWILSPFSSAKAVVLFQLYLEIFNRRLSYLKNNILLIIQKKKKKTSTSIRGRCKRFYLLSNFNISLHFYFLSSLLTLFQSCFHNISLSIPQKWPENPSLILLWWILKHIFCGVSPFR